MLSQLTLLSEHRSSWNLCIQSILNVWTRIWHFTFLAYKANYGTQTSACTYRKKAENKFHKVQWPVTKQQHGHWPASKRSLVYIKRDGGSLPLRQRLANHQSESVSSWTLSGCRSCTLHTSVIKYFSRTEGILQQLIISVHSKSKLVILGRDPFLPLRKSCGERWAYDKLLWSFSLLHAKDFLTSCGWHISTGKPSWGHQISVWKFKNHIPSTTIYECTGGNKHRQQI